MPSAAGLFVASFMDAPVVMQVPWHLVILDEAHQIKNEKTSGFKAAMALRTCFRCIAGKYLELFLMPNHIFRPSQ